MFKKNDVAAKEPFDTLLGSNSTFEGNIESEGTVKVDGKVKGDLKAKGDVYIGSKAVICGNVYANEIQISGTIDGNVYSKGLLRLHSTSKIFGDIEVHSLIADEGAYFQGKCIMSGSVSTQKNEKRENPGYDIKINSPETDQKVGLISKPARKKEEPPDLQQL